VTADKLTAGVRLEGSLWRPICDGVDYAELPAVVADCRPEPHNGHTEMHVWWTVGGDCWYPLDTDLPVLEVAS
jgi:hypothetical protein